MRWRLGMLACMALAGCSKAPDPGAGETTSHAGGVAFAYRYDLRLPASRISDAQERQAAACEAMGLARCRITGMTYRLDDAGRIDASLDVALAAANARAFGRSAIRDVEQAGGTLTGAEITGTDAAPAMASADRVGAEAQEDVAAIDRQLSQANLPAGMRNRLLARRADRVATQRDQARTLADAQASVAITPMHFVYQTGTGVGLSARLAEAAEAGYWSLTLTLASALTLLAYAGPPLFILLLLALAWHRAGRHWWQRLFPDRD